MENTSTIYFYIPNQLTLLDLSGILEVFQEAKAIGLSYSFKFISNQTHITSTSGLILSELKSYITTQPKQNDIVIIPGFSTNQIQNHTEDESFFKWLNTAHENKATLCSICTGAFLLAKSGLLNHQKCTTHWKLTRTLKKEFPLVNVQDNILYTESNNIYTSAGISTGIDLALHLIEERHSKQIALEIAKELVVYKRRDGADKQQSVYVQYRDHKDELIHTIQDWIINNLDQTSNIEFLAKLVHISPRSLTRIFKKRTGITISAYRTTLRVEKAKSLLLNADYKIEHIAQLCGYKTSKQLRLVLVKQLKHLPSELKNYLAE